jgi:hypothetical protein
MKLYGGGCAPEICDMAAANEDKVLSAQEKVEAVEDVGGSEVAEEIDFINLSKEQVERSNTYKAIPLEIDNRKRNIVDVVCFNAKNKILDLLEDQAIFGNLANLVVSNTIPFLPYVNPRRKSMELIDGTWYSKTISCLKSYTKDPLIPKVEFVFPLVLYVDKTGTSINQRYPLEPFIFTTAIIKK